LKNIDIKNDRLTENDIPLIEIIDPHAFVTSNKVIANVKIKGTRGEQTRKILRTKNGGYMFQ
jgi:aspartate carbamoyltransferase regulatory subunit